MTMTMQEYLTRQEQRSTTQATDAKINYFNSLKSSGQTAIVRFYPYKEANDFKFTFTHSANKGGKFFGRIKCLREDSSDDRSLCPACAAGGKLEARVYIKMLVYTPTVDPTTNAQVQVAEPVVWDRPTGIVTELLSKLSTYGLSDLSQTVFKITRQGTSRQDTRYTIDYLPSDMANPQVYSNDFSAFNGYDEIARAVRHLPAQTMLNEMAEKYVEEVKNLTSMVVAKAVEEIDPEDMDEDLLSMITSASRLLAYSNKLVIEQANAIDKMNEKLDTLLNRK